MQKIENISLTERKHFPLISPATYDISYYIKIFNAFPDTQGLCDTEHWATQNSKLFIRQVPLQRVSDFSWTYISDCQETQDVGSAFGRSWDHFH